MNALPAIPRAVLPGFCNRLLYWFLIICALCGCSHPQETPHFTIGFSQCVESDAWRKTMLEGMKRELAFYPNTNFIYRQADNNSALQIKQVKELLHANIDLLIISPNEARPLTPVVEEAYNKGIPVIVIDRKTASALYTAYIGADNYEIGKLAGQYAANLLHNQGNIMEITGLPASSPAIERHKGFTDALAQHPGIKLSRQINGEWLQQSAMNQLARSPKDSLDVQLVFAHNDRMAYGTHEFYSSQPGLPMPKIIGVDGLPGNNGGMQLVNDRVLTATMLYPTGGEEAIRTAMKILQQEDFKKENLLQTTVLDSTNVRVMELQASKIGSQQQQIERQQSRLYEQVRIYNDQQTYLYILVGLLALAVGLGGLSLYSLNENRKKNRMLRRQNEEISDQKNRLEEMSARAQAANDARVNFFTNISHEFRTPLTLILGPLEELMGRQHITAGTSQQYTLIHKNVIRLLRLMNQLIDFRKVELNKMKLQAAPNDLVAFTEEIIASYKIIARQRQIDLRLITNERKLEVWFDGNMLDKVIFNLLSNAFKFTKDHGFVLVYIQVSEDGRHAVVKVEDNGIGMKPESVAHAFDMFYQGEFENYKGSGLGLSLSKELIQLHGGTISVTSEKWKGATFEVRLPLGKEHLSAADIAGGENTQPLLYDQEKVYTADLLADLNKVTLQEGLPAVKEYSMLLIEDHADLRSFLKDTFCNNFEILEAENGQSAVQQAFDHVPDIIISDVMIPGKDGISLINIFKHDVRTSHIPIILLTAQTGIEKQVEGMKGLADIYMTKPFNVKFLKQTVESLLNNRAKLKDHFTGALSTSLKTQTVGKLDRKFISEFTAYIESNIGNEDLNVDEICRSMGISRMQLYRKVKAVMNTNVNDYILNTRLQKARYLLQHGDQNISEIAFKVGFSSAAYFSTVFKSKFGLTPKGFKEGK